MIGINEGSIKAREYFYNDFISKILFKGDVAKNVQLIQECKNTLERVAIVNFEMTQADAVVYTKVSVVPIDILTGIGGLLSLYLGVSFLSVVEVATFIVRPLFTFLGMCLARCHA